MEAIGKDGRYELGGELGKSSRGVVYAAMDLQRRRPVVVRRFEKSITPGPLAKYAETIKRVGQAGVTGVVIPHELVTTGPTPFAVFPVLDGGSLESMLAAGPIPWARAMEIVGACAEALAGVYEATGVTHGGLKPGNVWITEKGKALVLDLGAAGLGPPGPVRRGAEFVEYRAPEQLDGAPGDARADVFALGVLLVEMTSGIHPFAGATAFKAAHKLLQTPPDAATVTRGLSANVAQEVAKFMARALAGSPAERHADPRAFVTALAYVRKIVGAPAPVRTERAPAPSKPAPVAPPAPDPTTVLRIPGLSELFKHRPASPPAPAVAKDPPPAEPTAHAPDPPQPAPVSAPISAPRSVAPDRTERHQRPAFDASDDATQALPRITARATPSRPAATVAAPLAAIDDESTQMLPVSARRPAKGVPDPVDRTEIDMRRPRIDDAPRDPPAIEMTLHGPPLRVARPSAPEITMRLPETGEHTLVRIDPAGSASANVDPDRPSPATSTDPAARRPSPQLQWILIAINVFVAIALIVIAWATL